MSAQLKELAEYFAQMAKTEPAGAVRDAYQHAAEMATTCGDEAKAQQPAPIPMRLPCPGCGALHIDEGEFATRPHHTHACQDCGLCWRPAVVPTVGVRFLPGFKNEAP